MADIASDLVSLGAEESRIPGIKVFRIKDTCAENNAIEICRQSRSPRNQMRQVYVIL